MQRVAALGTIVLGLTVGIPAQATMRDNGTVLQPNSRIHFGGITCVATSTTYSALTCVSSSDNYEVTISKTNIVVVRARDGRVVYKTP
jgi:hypothetical protein